MNRAMPALALLALTLTAFGSAFGLNTALRFAVAPSERAQPASSGEAAELDMPLAAAKSAGRSVNRVRSETEYLHDILKRNIFDIEFIKNYQPIRPGASREEVTETRTDLKVKLLGTVVAVPASYSSALIVEDGEDIAIGYGIGDRIHDAEVIGIEQKLVTLKRGDGRIEQLTMDDTQRPPPSRPVAASSDDSGKTEGIEQLSETSFVVDRELLDKHLQDIEGLSRLGRALLNRGPDGSFDGYRLSAIRRNTVVDQLGVKNGDVIHSVNGQPLNSVQGAMNAYQNLSNERNFSLEVTRQGKKMTLEYQVR